MIETHAHAAMLIQQLRSISSEIDKLPTNDVIDDTRYPNKLQQQALLKRASEAALHALWALEEYNNGELRDGYKTTMPAPVIAIN